MKINDSEIDRSRRLTETFRECFSSIAKHMKNIRKTYDYGNHPPTTTGPQGGGGTGGGRPTPPHILLLFCLMKCMAVGLSYVRHCCLSSLAFSTSSRQLQVQWSRYARPRGLRPRAVASGLLQALSARNALNTGGEGYPPPSRWLGCPKPLF